MTATQRIVHQVRKDLRGLTLPLLTTVAVLAAFGIADIATYRSEDAFEGASVILMLAGLGLVVFSVALIFQADGAMGTRSFWLTRPLRGGEMVVSKALLFLLVAGVALAAWVLPPLFGGAGSLTLGFLREYWMIIFPILAGVAMVSAFSGSLPQAILVAGVFFLAVLVPAYVIWGVLGVQPAQFREGPDVRLSVLAVCVLICGAGALAVVVVLYLRRAILPGAIVAGIALTSAFATHQFLNVDFFSNKLTPDDERESGLAQVTLRVDMDREKFNRGSHTIHLSGGKTLEYVTFGTAASIDGLPRGMAITGVQLEGGLVEDGKMTDRRRIRTWSPSGATSVLAHPHAYDVGDIEVFSGWHKADELGFNNLRFLEVDEGRFEELSGRSFPFEAVARMEVARMEKVGSVRIGEDQVFAGDGWRVHLAVFRNSDGIVEGSVRCRGWSPMAKNGDLDFRLLLVNPTKKQAFTHSGGGGGGRSGRHRHMEWSYSFSSIVVVDRQPFTIDEEWLADAEVMLFRPVSLGTIERTISEEVTLP